MIRPTDLIGWNFFNKKGGQYLSAVPHPHSCVGIYLFVNVAGLNNAAYFMPVKPDTAERSIVTLDQFCRADPSYIDCLEYLDQLGGGMYGVS